jgi:hypothetical protein
LALSVSTISSASRATSVFGFLRSNSSRPPHAQHPIKLSKTTRAANDQRGRCAGAFRRGCAARQAALRHRPPRQNR